MDQHVLQFVERLFKGRTLESMDKYEILDRRRRWACRDLERDIRAGLQGQAA